MLSIIICHRKKELLDAIKESIEHTVGAPYELIIVDNTNNEYNILSAYNEGVRRAKFDILCFTHEDVLFYSNNWGSNVLAHFEDDATGMIGVAGGMVQSMVPSAWWYNNYFSRSARNLLMRKKSSDSFRLYHHYSNPFSQKPRTEVAIIDGLWFCIRASLFEKIRFDEITFTGFHLYDADISMQVGLHAKRYVIFDLILEHIWSGKISADYYTELQKFTKKWQQQLPEVTNNTGMDYVNIYNWHALRNVILEMRMNKIPATITSQLYKTYYPQVKKQHPSKWFDAYFRLSGIIGYENANRIFYRLEKLFGISDTSKNLILDYEQPTLSADKNSINIPA